MLPKLTLNNESFVKQKRFKIMCSGKYLDLTRMKEDSDSVLV
jgi:hypothetical protein